MEGEMKVRALAGVLLASAGLGLAACGGDSTALETGPIVGSWTLVEIDGQPLPIKETAIFQDWVCELTLTEFNITFRGDRTYVGNDMVTRVCIEGPTHNLPGSLEGTWRTSGSILFMRERTGPEAALVHHIEGSVLTIVGEDEDGTPIVQVLHRR
jgi:hypothetical protein